MANPEWDNYASPVPPKHTFLPTMKEAWEDATVHRAFMSGASVEQLVAQLVAEKKSLFKRISQLEAIAPRKITTPDGRVMVWHCPDHLIPENKI